MTPPHESNSLMTCDAGDSASKLCGCAFDDHAASINHPDGTKISFSTIAKMIDDARTEVFGDRQTPLRAKIYFSLAIAGAIFTIASALTPALRSTWNSLLGFSLELIGGAAYIYSLMGGSSTAESSDARELERYDALHVRYRAIAHRVAATGGSEVHELSDTLTLFGSTGETTNKWLLGSSEKLGAIPALVALLVQAPTLSGSHGIVAIMSSAMLVIVTFGFCALSAATAAAQVRDQRMTWILKQADAILNREPPTSA